MSTKVCRSVLPLLLFCTALAQAHERQTLTYTFTPTAAPGGRTAYSLCFYPKQGNPDCSIVGPAQGFSKDELDRFTQSLQHESKVAGKIEDAAIAVGLLAGLAEGGRRGYGSYTRAMAKLARRRGLALGAGYVYEKDMPSTLLIGKTAIGGGLGYEAGRLTGGAAAWASGYSGESRGSSALSALTSSERITVDGSDADKASIKARYEGILARVSAVSGSAASVSESSVKPPGAPDTGDAFRDAISAATVIPGL